MTNDPTAIQLNQKKEKSSVTRALSDQSKNKHKKFWVYQGWPQIKNPALKPRVPVRE